MNLKKSDTCQYRFFLVTFVIYNFLQMRKIVLLILLVFCFTSATNLENVAEKTTTYYFIRHAEKDRSNSANQNPDLNKKGVVRAKKWAKYFKKIHLDAVYATNYNRTQQTAKPTAESKKLKVLPYNPSDLYNDEFQKATHQKTVLVVGHSNTTPAFVNKILGYKKYVDMNDNDNKTIFIVTIKGDKKMSRTEKIY